ncbi:hypothetical protein MU458_14065 [Staphylococcus aureus]|nr:hypothetical protein [Staphylococcus aureus]
MYLAGDAGTHFASSGGEAQWKQSASVMAAGRLVNAGAGRRGHAACRGAGHVV